MKRIAFALSVMILIFAVAVQAQTPAQTETEHATQELITLRNEWNDAVVKQDWAFIDRILAEDFIFTTTGGTVWTKVQYLGYMKSGDEVFKSIVTDDFIVHLYGDTAVVSNRNIYKEAYKGKDVSGQRRLTTMWVKRAGRWQCIAMHISEIPQK